jgi:hypothetical protein
VSVTRDEPQNDTHLCGAVGTPDVPVSAHRLVDPVDKGPLNDLGARASRQRKVANPSLNFERQDVSVFWDVDI